MSFSLLRLTVSPMEGLSRIYCVTIIAACIFSGTKGNIFGKSIETIYNYNADVRVGTVNPAAYASQFGLSGRLIIQSSKDGSSALFQLKDLKTQAYNGPLSFDDQPKTTPLQLHPDSFALEQPFEVIYDRGLVKSIKTDDDEKQSLWAINIKKSIATIFQLDMEKLHLDKSYSFVSTEKTIYGNQFTENSVMVKQKGHATLRKLSPQGEKSRENAYQYWSNLEGMSCTSDFWNTLNRATDRQFDIDTSEDSMVINKVQVHGLTSFSPYATKGFSQYVKVKQAFNLEKQRPLSQNYHSHKGKEYEPTFTFVRFDEVFGNRHSLSGEKGIPNKDTLINTVHKQLQDLVDILEEVHIGGPNDGEGFLEKKHDHSNFISYKLMGVLGYMDFEMLKQCYSQIGVGTSYKEEMIRDLFLDILSQVGTKASMLLLKDLITSQSIKEESAMKMLKTIPFYARQADAELLEKYESLLELKYSDQVKQAATLSFATLVNRACKNNKCQPEVLEKYVLRYFDLFKESTEYQWQLNYLEGLSNIEIGKVVEYLEPIIKGEQHYSHHIRFLAMWATRLHAIQDPKRVLEVYWPILEDKSQHLELRVGAFVILLLSMPLPERFNSLAALMEEEPQDSHLYYFFYSTMQSLSGTKHPCYQIMKKSAQNILLYAKPPRKELKWTGNHMFDYSDHENPYGALLQQFMVADQSTGGPNVFYFLHNDNYFGRSQNMFSFYVKVQGIKRFFQDKIIKLDGEEKLTKLKQLLSSLNIDNSKDTEEPIHVELIVQFQDRAIFTHYYNETTFSDIFETLKTMGTGFESDFHINYQRLLFPMINELTGPTDLGTPLSLTIPIPFIFSLRGNFTHNIVETKITRKAQIDIKYWRHGGAFLTVYNPFGNLWHGVSRMHSTLIHIPINSHFSLDILKNNIKFAISGLENSVPGVALHAGSNVFALPTSKIEVDQLPQFLHESCPSCLAHHTVKGMDHHNTLEETNEDLEKLNLNLIFRYFDCDVSNIQFYMEALFANAYDDIAVDANGRLSLTELNILAPLRIYNELMYLPVSGRCGFVAKVTPKVNSDTNGVMVIVQLVSDDSKNKEKGKITSAVPFLEKYHVEGSLLIESSIGVVQEVYDWSLIYQSCEANLNHHLKFKFSESAEDSPAGERIKVCLDAELHYPEPPVDPLRQRDPNDEEVTGALNVVVGLASHNKCPKKGLIAKISGRANPVPDKSKACYAECVADRNLEAWAPEISSLMPTTQACLDAALDSTELRRLEFSTEVPEFVSKLTSKALYAVYIIEGTDPWGKYLLSPEYSIEEYPVIKDGEGYVVEFTPNGFMLVDTFEDGERERFVFTYDVTSSHSSRFIQSWTSSGEEEFERSCVMTASSISAFDDSAISYQTPSCYTLAFGHCHTSKPLFAALVRKIEVTKQLALQFFNLGHSIEIIPGMNNSVNILVNGQSINFDQENVYKFEDQGKKIFRVWQRLSKKEKDSPLYLSIYAAKTDILLEYTGFRVISTINSMFDGDICGLCEGLNKSQSLAKWETCTR